MCVKSYYRKYRVPHLISRFAAKFIQRTVRSGEINDKNVLNEQERKRKQRETARTGGEGGG